MNKWLLTAGLIGISGQAFAADTVAPKVTASVAPGTYTSAQTFTLSVTDNVDTAPKIYYTKDGSVPTTNSSYYKSGLKIKVVDKGVSRDLWLRTLAVDSSGNSRLQSFNYYIQSAPVVTPSVTAGSYTSNQSITLSVKDESDTAPVIYYTTDGTMPTTSSTKYVAGTKIAANGTSATTSTKTRIRTLAMDSEGNYQRQIFDYQIKASADVTAPTVTVSPAAGSYTSAQSVAFTVKDDTDSAPKLYYTTDGTSATASSTLYTGAITVSKSTTINTYAVDATGNHVSASYSYVIDDNNVGDGYLLDEYGATGIAVYFNPGTWSAAKIHYYNVLPSGSYTTTTWPGVAMTSVGNGWYLQSFPAATSVSMVFNNGSGTQYPSSGSGLTRTESGCFDMTSKAWTALDTCTAPITATPASSVADGTSFSDDELAVTLSLTGASSSATGLLTLDGVAPTVSHGLSFKNGQKLKLGKNLAVGKSITLWLSYNGQETKYTYTKKAVVEGITVQVQVPSTWSAANVHYFTVTPSTITNSTWPGVAMTAEGDNWYTYTLKGAEKASFVFNYNGDANKTKDLTGITESGCYTVTAGSVPTATTCPVPTPAVTATPGVESSNYSFTEATGVDVTLSASNAGVTSGCYTTDGTDPSTCAKTFNSGDKINIGNGSAVGDSFTLRLYAKSSTYSTSKSATYTYKHTKAVAASTFSWDNATVYFVLTDRFRNGDTSNDHSYGRECPQSAYNVTTQKVTTASCYSGYEKREGNFRGGDLQGILDKLNDGYFTDLGVNAIWLSVPFEQIHGFVGGEYFKHYPYHGYYTLDFSNIDANLGDTALMKTVIDKAHSLGIRVIFDVVMNHVGYDDMETAYEYGFAGLTSNWASYYYTSDASTIHYNTYANYLNYSDSNWANWWGSDWVRSKVYGTCTGSDDLTKCLDDLPDLKTEATAAVGLPPLLKTKWTREGRYATETASLDSFFTSTGLTRTPANYVIKWLTDWVRNYGVDGFRCDTAKHVDLAVWKQLKTQANAALHEWQKKSGVIKPDDQDLDFWMTGEVWGHGVGRSTYYDNGFDSIINFAFQSSAATISNAESIYSSYNSSMHGSTRFNALSYISSHDTSLFDRTNLTNAGTFLLMLPGEVQIFYGDESARPKDDYATHWNEPTRSFMNWCDGSLGATVSTCTNTTLLKHWQKLGQFRNKHRAIGGGQHAQIAASPYTFSRVLDNDKVVVAFGVSGSTTISVGSIFSNGTVVKDYYTGNTATVANGSVTLTAGGVALLEAAE